MVVAHNLNAMNAQRQYNLMGLSKKKSTEKLSSGYKINRAADNAAGLAISEKMRKQIRGLDRGADNIQDGISYVQVADGALAEVTECLQRINVLSVQAANGTNSASDREAINNEVQELKTEMQRIFVTTSFNERKIWEENKTGAISGTWEYAGKEQVAAFAEDTMTILATGDRTSKITDQNVDIISAGVYTIHANENIGVTVSWTGMNGVSYETDPISWETFKSGIGGKEWSFDIGDYYKSTDTELFDVSTGKPLFSRVISIDVSKNASIRDIVESIDKRAAAAFISNSPVFQFEESDGTKSISSTGFWIEYAFFYNVALYASKANGFYTYDNDDDSFIYPINQYGDDVQNTSISDFN